MTRSAGAAGRQLGAQAAPAEGVTARPRARLKCCGLGHAGTGAEGRGGTEVGENSAAAQGGESPGREAEAPEGKG